MSEAELRRLSPKKAILECLFRPIRVKAPRLFANRRTVPVEREDGELKHDAQGQMAAPDGWLLEKRSSRGQRTVAIASAGGLVGMAAEVREREKHGS